MGERERECTSKKTSSPPHDVGQHPEERAQTRQSDVRKGSAGRQGFAPQRYRHLDPAGGNAASTCPREDCVPLRTPCSKRSAAQSFSVSVVDDANQKTTYDGSHQPIYEGRGRPQRAKERRRVDTHATANVAFPESFSRTLICLLDARMLLCRARTLRVKSKDRKTRAGLRPAEVRGSSLGLTHLIVVRSSSRLARHPNLSFGQQQQHA